MTIAPAAEQPREDDGKFGSKNGLAPEVDLRDAGFGDASFEYPPRSYADANDLIMFWENVPVPASSLDALRLSYTGMVEAYADTAGEDAVNNLGNTRNDIEQMQESNPAKWMKLVRETREKGRTDALIEWEKNAPINIQRHEARDVARGLQMWYYSGLVPDKERPRVLKHTVAVGSSQTTVADLQKTYKFCDDYGFDASSFESFDDRILGEIASLRGDLQNFRELDQLDAVFAERAENLAARDAEFSRGRRGK